VPPAATDPPCRQRQCLAAGFSKSCVEPRRNQSWRRWECSGLSLGQGSQTTTPTQNPCSERSSIGRATPAGPMAARTRLRMGSCICGLVQPPAPPQRHQVRDAASAPQRIRKGNLPAASRGLRRRTPCQSNALEPEHLLLATTRRGVDQQANRGAQSGPGATLNPVRLSGSKVVTPFLKVTALRSRSLKKPL
jgi:hypothetical protein